MIKDKEGEGKSEGKVSRKRAGGPTKTRRVDGSVQASIGNRLRAYYDEVAREPVPERFVELLKRLDTPEAEKD
jgi:hypothetical protein